MNALCLVLTIPPMDQAAILRNYRELRRKSVAINTRLVESLSGEEMRDAASALGILHGKNGLVLQTEDELSVLMDDAIYNLFRDGKNAVDRLLEGTTTGARQRGRKPKSHFVLILKRAAASKSKVARSLASV